MKTVLKVVGIVVAVLIVAAIAVPFLVNVNSFRPQIESNLSSALGRPVRVGNLSLSILSGSVEANELSIADDPKFSSAPFIQAKALKVGVELMPLIFSKQLNVTHLTIEHPEITLLRNREGVWNFSSLGNQAAGNQAAGSQSTPPAKAAETPTSTPAGAPANVHVAKLDLTDGVITLGSISGKRKPVVYDKVNISMRDFSFSSAFPVNASARLPGGGNRDLS